MVLLCRVPEDLDQYARATIRDRLGQATNGPVLVYGDAMELRALTLAREGAPTADLEEDAAALRRMVSTPARKRDSLPSTDDPATFGDVPACLRVVLARLSAAEDRIAEPVRHDEPPGRSAHFLDRQRRRDYYRSAVEQ